MLPPTDVSTRAMSRPAALDYCTVFCLRSARACRTLLRARHVARVRRVLLAGAALRVGVVVMAHLHRGVEAVWLASLGLVAAAAAHAANLVAAGDEDEGEEGADTD